MPGQKELPSSYELGMKIGELVSRVNSLDDSVSRIEKKLDTFINKFEKEKSGVIAWVAKNWFYLLIGLSVAAPSSIHSYKAINAPPAYEIQVRHSRS